MYVIITADQCKWCDKAKDALFERGIPYFPFDTADPGIRQLLFAFGVKTVPQIFKAALGNHPLEYIGGYDDLKKHLDYEDFHNATNL